MGVRTVWFVNRPKLPGTEIVDLGAVGMGVAHAPRT